MAISEEIQQLPTEQLTEKIYCMLADGYNFLFSEGSAAGHWNEARSTALAGICLSYVCRENSPWRDLVKNWILQAQQEDGSWGDEIWDTAMCLLALINHKSREIAKQEAIRKALDWIGTLYSLNGRNNWHDEHWETSWALLAILRSGRTPTSVDIESAITWLLTDQARDGRIISPHYTAYFLLIHQALPKVGLAGRFTEAQERARQYLINELQMCDESRLWTGEAWSNGQILWALAGTNAFPIEDGTLVRKAVTWFDSQQTANVGNWSDVEDTASAILGLMSLLQELVSVSEGHQSHRIICDELRSRVVEIKPYVSRGLWEPHKDGSVSINLSHRAVEWTYKCGAAVATIATVGTLVDLAIKYWGGSRGLHFLHLGK